MYPYIWLLPGVYSHMNRQATGIRERLLTHITFERLFSRVLPHMNVQVPRMLLLPVKESHLRICNMKVIRLQVEFTYRKAFFALAALKRLFKCMFPHVYCQIAGMAKTFTTQK